ncbi:DUF2087 domain-containing protein [Roseobacter sp.]|uniref:DUF2087 domain-containing protein n=1 Tax=Roseobacter sp. TaxID=1907202 RepID=UPI0039900F1B
MHGLVERALHQFDDMVRLKQWPSSRSVQTLALWALWTTLPAGRSMPEREVNALLSREHLFYDPATLRRTMISCGFVVRRRDGTDYRRISPNSDTLPREGSIVAETRKLGRRLNCNFLKGEARLT